jgi:hypothetical protein
VLALWGLQMSETLFHPFPREECLVIVENPDGSYMPVCKVCHYVGRDQSQRGAAKGALVGHRTGREHRRRLRNARTARVPM